MLREFTRADTVKTNTQEALAETNLPTEIQTTKDKLRGLKEMVDEGLIYLGWMYDEGRGVPQNYAEAVKWWRKAAEQGNEGTQIRLALMFRHGWGVSKNVAEAVKWYRKAAEQGNADAQYWLENSKLNNPKNS